MKRFASILISFLTVVPMAFAAPENCGNGDQRFTVADNGETVLYAAPQRDFIVTRVEENKITVEDTKDCRYGKDTIYDIEEIRFIDGTVLVGELVDQSNKNLLGLDVLRAFVRDSLDALVVEDETQNQETIVQVPSSITSNVATGVTIAGAPTFNGPNVYSPSGGYDSFFAAQQGTYDSSSFAPTNNFAPTNTFVPPAPTPSFNAQPQTVPAYYNPQTGQYVPVTGATPQTATIVSDPTVNMQTSWNPNAVGYYDIVYFEASYDEGGTREYLGSALGYQGAASVSVPRSLLDQPNLKIHIRSGSQVLSTVSINAQPEVGTSVE